MKNHRPDGILIRILEEGYRMRAWHGPNLKGSFRGLSAQEAAWRPSPRRHNIWEIVLHAAYWKYAVRRTLTGEKRGSFPIKGSNFFRRPAILSERSWQADKRILEAEHQRLLDAARTSLAPGAPRKKITRMLYGIAFHDVYHAGQIRLLRRMAGKKR